MALKDRDSSNNALSELGFRMKNARWERASLLTTLRNNERQERVTSRSRREPEEASAKP
ncbi:MAG: hypothetical protein ACR652_00885 [Methylocystis sp.]|uniref:hypothetical protein n=1 Tax=Methylocystis sp. TaxID=1911079 RepID=UPI003DA31C81